MFPGDCQKDRRDSVDSYPVDRSGICYLRYLRYDMSMVAILILYTFFDIKVNKFCTCPCNDKIYGIKYGKLMAFKIVEILKKLYNVTNFLL